MTRFSFCTLTIALCLAANAATVRTASETFVTNKIAAAIAAIPEPDFSPSNATLVATIEETSPAPGDYATVSNKAMTALQSYTETDPTIPGWAKSETQPLPPDYSNVSNKAMTALQSFTETDPTVPGWAKSETQPLPPDYSNVSNKATTALQSFTETDPTVHTWAKAANKPTYTASEVGATTPADVTAAIREQSLGGIWDAELEVWWTPRMRNGNLTYEATTNVNLNAVN